MESWIPVAAKSDFSLQNLPYGIFSTEKLTKRIGVAIGDYILDLKALSLETGFISSLSLGSALQSSTLNAYAALLKETHRKVRSVLQDFLVDGTKFGCEIRDDAVLRSKILASASQATMHVPFEIGDYTDFLLSPYHAINCTDIVRPGSAVPPNQSSLPVAYHGRAFSIVISGIPCRRPAGQIWTAEGPIFGACKRLDFEVEFAACVGRSNEHGCPIGINEAEDHIFGVVLMNDWSARDIQFWEPTPLGPFNGKNFCTTISPWVVTLEALEPFRCKPHQPGPCLSYLRETRPPAVWDIPYRAMLKGSGADYLVSDCNTKNVSFSFGQMIAHHTAGGCPLRTVDLIATGTLSGPSQETLGCLLELTRNGINELKLTEAAGGGSTIVRRYLEDGDTVEFRAQAKGGECQGNVGFGVCTGQILPCPQSKYF